MMWINLRSIRESGQPLHLQRRYSEDDLKFDSEVGQITNPAEVDLTITLSGDVARVRGAIQGAFEVECCRCLGRVALTVDQRVDLEYSPDPEVAEEGEEFELEYDDLGTAFYRDDRIDLQALINEQFLLEVPMKPVCREDCKGLCPPLDRPAPGRLGLAQEAQEPLARASLMDSGPKQFST